MESNTLDSLIIEKCDHLRVFLGRILPAAEAGALHSLPLDLKQVDLFKLFLFMGGTPDTLYDLIVRKYELAQTSNENKVTLKEYTSCLFELLSSKLAG